MASCYYASQQLRALDPLSIQTKSAVASGSLAMLSLQFMAYSHGRKLNTVIIFMRYVKLVEKKNLFGTSSVKVKLSITVGPSKLIMASCYYASQQLKALDPLSIQTNSIVSSLAELSLQ